MKVLKITLQGTEKYSSSPRTPAMENFRAPNEENIDPKESISERIKDQVIALLESEGLSYITQDKISKWLESKGMKEIQENSDIDSYVGLKREEIELYISCGQLEKAREELEELILLAEANGSQLLGSLFDLSYELDDIEN